MDPSPYQATDVEIRKELARLQNWQNEVEYAVRLLLARIQEAHGLDYWSRRPDTDLQAAAQKVAAIIKP